MPFNRETKRTEDIMGVMGRALWALHYRIELLFLRHNPACGSHSNYASVRPRKPDSIVERKTYHFPFNKISRFVYLLEFISNRWFKVSSMNLRAFKILEVLTELKRTLFWVFVISD